MDAELFIRMFSDKSFSDLAKMSYKYGKQDTRELVDLLKTAYYKSLPIKDFKGNDIIWLDKLTRSYMPAEKILLTPQNSNEAYGYKAMEEEISATLSIEEIDHSRDSIRKILKGFAPADESEYRIFGLKKGLEFISDIGNKITEENIYELYQLSIGDYLSEKNRLYPGQYYRHDSVYLVGTEIEHHGLPYQKLPEYMQSLVQFIAEKSEMDDLLKAATIHFYLAYIHPYFDGNGRMARLLHFWYLIQQGYPSTLYVSLSSYIEKTRSKYYRAFRLCEQNMTISSVLDITPFLQFMIEKVYLRLDDPISAPAINEIYNEALKQGQITEKEKDLWNFVLSVYANEEFSTKQLERDFGKAAYATIRSFVLKFEGLGILTSQKYGNRVKYRINTISKTSGSF